MNNATNPDIRVWLLLSSAPASVNYTRAKKKKRCSYKDNTGYCNYIPVIEIADLLNDSDRLQGCQVPKTDISPLFSVRETGLDLPVSLQS